MEKNEIKKALYKQSVQAKFQRIRKGIAYYDCEVFTGNNNIGGDNCELIVFAVPIEDMGDADFFVEMEAKHLIRWIL